jgi:hypothetical protein
MYLVSLLQKAIDVTTQKYETAQLYKSKESLIVLVQALVRGFLVRRTLRERFAYFKSRVDQIVKIQVSFFFRITADSVCVIHGTQDG